MTTNAASSLEFDLNQRLNFLKFGQRDIARLEAIRPILPTVIPEALSQFYAKLRVVPEVAKFFRDDAHIEHAKAAQVRHWNVLSSGRLDRTYVESVRRIGQVHAKIGLEPRWYIGGYASIIEHLIKALVVDHAATPLLGIGGRGARETLADNLIAILKVSMLDMDYAISVYIEASEAARLAAETEQARERQVAQEERTKVMSAVRAGLAALARNDLAYRMTEDLPKLFEQLRSDFNDATDRLDTALQNVMTKTNVISESAAEILSAADSLSQRTQRNAAALEQSSAALEQTTNSIQHTAQSTATANEIVRQATSQAKLGSSVIDQVASAMRDIEGSSSKIGRIIGVIDEIAFQTNLLALNAGVEAARAGEQGRGFAVVASEVRALSQRTTNSAKEITQLVHESQSNVKSGVDLVKDAAATLVELNELIVKVNTLVGEVARGAEEQSRALREISSAIATMDQDTQSNAAMAEQATAATSGLTTASSELKELVQQFTISGDMVRAPGQGRPVRPREAQDEPAASRVVSLRSRPATSAPRASTGIKTVNARSGETWDEF